MSDFDLSNYPVLPAEPTGELREKLGRVKYVFTDLDATMLAPGSCALSDNEGNPSTALVEAIVALKRAGIEIIPCSGRARVMMHEDSRILGFNSYIGEMGGLLMLDLKANKWEYFTGDMPYDPDCGLTPHQVIEQAGVCRGIIDRWPGRIEYHNDMANGIKYREVTVGMRGEVPDEEAQAMIDVAGLGLVWGNNGYLTHVSRPTTLELGEDGPGRAFNIMPAGLNKGRGIERFCELRGIDRAETLAIGDSESDFLAARYVGTFVCVENALKDPATPALIAENDNVYLTRGRIVEGWVYMAKALLAARA